MDSKIKISDGLLTELTDACDAVIETGQRIRSDPAGHELALAGLCNVMGRLAEFQDSAPDLMVRQFPGNE